MFWNRLDLSYVDFRFPLKSSALERHRRELEELHERDERERKRRAERAEEAIKANMKGDETGVEVNGMSADRIR